MRIETSENNVTATSLQTFSGADNSEVLFMAYFKLVVKDMISRFSDESDRRIPGTEIFKHQFVSAVNTYKHLQTVLGLTSTDALSIGSYCLPRSLEMAIAEISESL